MSVLLVRCFLTTALYIPDFFICLQIRTTSTSALDLSAPQRAAMS